MIPQRRLTRNGFGNGVSCRIEACRRRLRTVRSGELQTRRETNKELLLESTGLKTERKEMRLSSIRKPGANEAEIT